jgi:alpha-ketoglutaric semialdehyde dehydrogenase
MDLTGKSIIGNHSGAATAEKFSAANPATGEKLVPEYFSAPADELNAAAKLAARAFTAYSRLPGKARGAFLRAIAAEIEKRTEAIVARATQETALPAARIQSEIGRTCGQLRFFAGIIEEGSWLAARIDRADPSRKPLAKPDVRSLLRPLGPVAVFCASNFPIAFSVAGGDTASALAAGNPVVVKAHPAHPGTAELVGDAVREAARACAMPEGVFSLLFDAGTRVGLELVKHPLIKAVGFTGSRAGGRALMAAAASRPKPIPFYAEMSSVNPVFVLPGALRERAAAIAEGLHTSVTLGGGQFCTKPGIVFLDDNAAAHALTKTLGEKIAATPEFALLTAGIQSSYDAGIEKRANESGVNKSAEGQGSGAAGFRVRAALFETEALEFLAHGDLADEIFGPASLVVYHSGREQMLEIARSLEGHLTATIHGTEQDLREHAELIAILETKVGRLVFNGYPTGVEGCHAMVHGGPFPATSDGRSTSVGGQAIYRFARPVCFQNFPGVALPDELKDENPLAIWRMIDGQWTRDAIPAATRAAT